MPLMIFNNLAINAEAARLREDILQAIDNDADELIKFLYSFLEARDAPGTTLESARVVKEHLANYNIRTVTVSPPNAAPSLTSLINHDEGSSLVMSSLLLVPTPDFPLSPSSITNDFYNLYNNSPRNTTSVQPSQMQHQHVTAYPVPTNMSIKTSTAATVAAYTYLHARQSLFSGSITLLALSDDEAGSYRSLDYLLHHDERKELFIGDCVLNASPTFPGNVLLGGDGSCGVSETLVNAVVRSVKDVQGRGPRVEEAKGMTYCDGWENLGVPVCSYGMERGAPSICGGAGTARQDQVDEEGFLRLVKVLTLAAWDYMREDGDE